MLHFRRLVQTENALEKLAYAAKDIIVGIDDFKPTGSSYDVQAYHLSKGHARSPGIMADLAIGLKYFLDFAIKADALTAEERSALAKRSWAALGEAVAAQAANILADEPTAVFLRLLRAALASGRAHLSGPEGNEPAEPQVWGWRQVEFTSGDRLRCEWRSQGHRLGWVEGGMVGSVEPEQVYLEPEASFAEVQSLARDQGESFAISPRTLHRRLHDKGLLVSTDTKREVLAVHRTLEGQRRNVLHLHAHLFHNRPDQPDLEDGNTEKTSTSGGRVGEDSCPDPATNPTTQSGQPDHGHNPTIELTTVNPCQAIGSGDVVGLVGSEMDDDGPSEINPFAADEGEIAF